MSTGKRLAKRSIIGTRVCAPGLDGKYYSGVIQAVKTAEEESRYSVRFDAGASCEYREHELVGPGFRSVAGLTLQPGQKVFLTYNGREVRGIVKSHQQQLDELMVAIEPPGQEQKLEVRKRLEEIRLLESRKSARLQDQDTDFARLADMAGDRRRTVSGSIDVPVGTGSRKRRPSYSQEDLDFMDECTAALVLMSLSCSPHSPRLTVTVFNYTLGVCFYNCQWSVKRRENYHACSLCIMEIVLDHVADDTDGLFKKFVG